MDIDDQQGQVMGGDWRTTLPSKSRKRIATNILDAFMKHIPFTGEEGLREIKKMALSFEERIYDSATSQSHYLGEILYKMMTMSIESENRQSNAASDSGNHEEPSSESMHSQVLSLLHQRFASLDNKNSIPNAAGSSMADNMHVNSQRQTQGVQQDSQQQPQPYLQQLQQTGSASGGDWKEEIYQKIKSMHEMYYPQLNAEYQILAAKLQQLEALHQHSEKEHLEKVRFLKLMLERLLMVLQTNKKDVELSHKENIVEVERQIVHILYPNRQQPQMQTVEGNMNQMQQNNLTNSQQQQQQQLRLNQLQSSQPPVNEETFLQQSFQSMNL